MTSPRARNTAYFDCNATTPALPAAAKAALLVMETLYGNPSSSHLAGLQAKAILESTRKSASRVLNCEPDQIIFTSGATEAIQTAVLSSLHSARERGLGAGTKLLYGATEHKAVPQALHHWVKAMGLPYEVVELPVDEQGQIRLADLRREIKNAALLCTMAVNNETGVIQNLDAIGRVLFETDATAFWLVDCVQALGKLPLSLNTSRIDYAPFSGHKLYAPKGIGFLYVSKRAPFTPLIVGGGQERGLRSGTENLPGVAALGAVLDILLKAGEPGQNTLQSHKRMVEFRGRLVETLRKAFPKVEFNMPLETSVPTTINFSIPGFSSMELTDLFDSAGMRLSAGSACNAASVKPSHVLDAMGLPEWKSTSAIRMSFGPCTSEAEIERGCQVIRESAIALQSSCLLDAPGGFQPPENLRDGLIQLRAGSTNSWIVSHREARSCIVIDPCDTLAERIEHYVRCQNLKVVAILDTHSHADHESVRPLLLKLLADHLSDPSATFDSLGWPTSKTKMHETVQLESGDIVPALRLGKDVVLARLHTPGHTNDSHALLLGSELKEKLPRKSVRFAFCGDTILSGGLGRTNFSISDPEALFRSLKAIHSVLDPHTMLCPAHDYTQSFATSLETEVRENPLLALATGTRPASETPLALSQFMGKKREIDTELERLEQTFQGTVCGVSNLNATGPCVDFTVSLSELSEQLKRGGDLMPLLIDVREHQEVALFKDWEALGLGVKIAPRNVPLSRFVNFMGELAASKDPNRPVVLICRSGTRSLQAAKTLQRLGLARARSLRNGLALTLSDETKALK